MAQGQKRNSIKVGLVDGNTISENIKPNVELLNEIAEKGSQPAEIVKPAWLISKVDHPIVLKIGDSTIRLSGRGKEKIPDHSLVSELPEGVTLRKV